MYGSSFRFAWAAAGLVSVFGTAGCGDELSVLRAPDRESLRVDDDADPRPPRRAAIGATPLSPPIRVLWVSLEPEVTQQIADDFINKSVMGLKQYFAQSSFGIWTADIRALSYPPVSPTCDANVLIDGAKRSAEQAGVNVAEYQQIQILKPKECGGYSFGLDGRTPFRSGMPRGRFNEQSWVTRMSCHFVVQEIAHNYGLAHAHFCPRIAPPTKTCPGYQEYGSPFTAMGVGCGQFSAWEVLQMSWFGGCNAVEVAGTGRFGLGPLGRPCDGPQVLMIKADAGTFQRYYYVEYRRPSGADTTLGVLVHYAPDPKAGGWTGCDYREPECPESFLVDVKDTGDAKQAILSAGERWESPEGVAVDVRALADLATIDVTFRNGSTAVPTCYLDGARPLDSPLAVCSPAPGGSGSDAGGGGGGGGGASGGGSGSDRVDGSEAPGGTGGQGGHAGQGGAPGPGGADAAGGASAEPDAGRGPPLTPVDMGCGTCAAASPSPSPSGLFGLGVVGFAIALRRLRRGLRH